MSVSRAGKRSVWTSSDQSPTSAEDGAAGYATGDVWIRTDLGSVWILTDASSGTWTLIS